MTSSNTKKNMMNLCVLRGNQDKKSWEIWLNFRTKNMIQSILPSWYKRRKDLKMSFRKKRVWQRNFLTKKLSMLRWWETISDLQLWKKMNKQNQNNRKDCSRDHWVWRIFTKWATTTWSRHMRWLAILRRAIFQKLRNNRNLSSTKITWNN